MSSTEEVPQYAVEHVARKMLEVTHGHQLDPCKSFQKAQLRSSW